MGRINEHRLRVRNKIQITSNKFEKGMIISCRYTPKETKVTKEYMMLILNPNFKDKLQKIRKVDFPKLQMAESSKRFYYSKLKKDISKKWGDSYRTFNKVSIGTSFVTDYKFNAKVENKFLTPPTSDKDVSKIIKEI